MKKLRTVAAVGAALFAVTLAPIAARPAAAVPTLQLDVSGGVYDATPDIESIVATSDSFTLYALLQPMGSSTLTTTYYISAAIAPVVGAPADLGSFVFNGTTVDVTSDMDYGTPPIEQSGGAGSDPGDLPPHGIYPTFFSEFDFTFDPNNTALVYNTQDDPGGPTPSPSGGLYYAAFSVDVSGLASGYRIVFDLYNTMLRDGGDIDVNDFAPFSHNAESGRQVPEPASLLLLGVGLIGVAVWRVRRAAAVRS